MGSQNAGADDPPPTPDVSQEPERLSDRSLIRRVHGGQTDASTEIYLRYAGRLLSLASSQSSADLARRVDPEDIVQSVFRTFFRRASDGLYTVADGEELWKLLLVIALNKVRASAAFHKAAKRDVRKTSTGEAFDHALEREHGQDETALATLRMVVEEMLQGLPESSRKAIEMRIEGHEVADIATTIQRSKRTVERVLQDFRERLDALINDGDR